MKKLSLQSGVYKKFFEIGDKVLKNISSDISLLNIATNFKKIVNIIYKNYDGNIVEDEVQGRTMHYIVLDNMNVIGDYLDNSDEVEILKTTFIGMFEILEIENDKVVFLDISTGKVFGIVGEGEGSESKLNNDFNKGDLIISRLIQINDGWYNMKTFYYITDKGLNNGYEELKLVYKNVFYGIRDMLDLEERMNLLNKNIAEVNNSENINYEKRIKVLLLKPLGKKQYKRIEKVLKNRDNKTYTEFFNILSEFKIDSKIIDELKSYVSSYIQENIKTPDQEKQSQLNARISIIMESFFKVLREENIDIPRDRKMTDEEFKKLEDRKNKWFEEKNSLFGNNTPKEFIHEIDSDYDMNNLRFQQIQEGEEEFYDGYTKYFTDEEKEIYEKALKNSTSGKYTEAVVGYGELLKEHNDFFRLRGNYISSFVNTIIDKYGKVTDKSFVDNIEFEELEKDFDFIFNVDNELKELDKLKKGYSIKGSDNFADIKKHFGPLLRMLVSEKKKQMIDVLIANKNEDELLKMVQNIIPDFEINEFIEAARECNTIFVDIYDDDRIDDSLGYKEDDIRDIFPYFWKKYKNKNDFIDDDVEKLYKNIGVRKLKKDGLAKFNHFILVNAKQIRSNKSKIRRIFKEGLEYGDIARPELILSMIDNGKNRSDFVLSMKVLKVVLD